ncbi:hypothetical protein F3157_17270 [Virgibacillus dakarensis]|uniref:Uncharacterized protein n=1 Tax=Lentibacillus populi TaxID=1827502 RepID=A0A9W5X7X4_9BACI|nr:hypothetical protein [Virgibacillus dakarensis]GGB60338.1 hypothetical protein GCM10011409_42120 [Lentibacillus populi]
MLKYLVGKFYYKNEHGLRADKIYLHTDNVVGRENMYHTLLSARKRGFIDENIKIHCNAITENSYFGS